MGALHPHAEKLYGAIEAGGTKWRVALGSADGELLAQARMPTTSPSETLAAVIEILRSAQAEHGAIAAAGIACFGPVDLDRASPTWGHITSTPKPGWADIDVAGTIGRALGVPVAFDTDVNGAALGEYRWGAARGLDTFLYLTIGTGIGGGGMAGGRLLHGLVHPEVGHLLLPRDPEKDPFPGICPFHGDCLEGLASGPAIAARWGLPAEELPADHPAWDLEAEYLALAAVNLVLTLSPQRLIFGGGVMERRELFPKIRHRLRDLLAGYVKAGELEEGLDDYVVPPALGDRAGLLGALALGLEYELGKRQEG